MSLADLPHAKWSAAGKQVILKDDFLAIEQAILETMPRAAIPALTYDGIATVKVQAAADSPAKAMLAGFPNIFNPSTCVSGGLSDGRYRINTTPAAMNFAVAADHYGLEKNSQWFAILAVAASADTAFTLKAMPYLRVKSQTGQIIDLGTNLTPGSAVGYGVAGGNWDTDSWAGAKIYVLSGTSKGEVRTILHNNNSTTAGNIEYSGAALTLAAGNWFIVLPNTNFQRLGDAYNNASGNLTQIDDFLFGKWPYVFATTGAYADPWWCPLTIDAIFESGAAGGGGGQAGSYGNPGTIDFKYPLSPTPGEPYAVTIGAGSINGDGTNTSLGALRVLTKGIYGANTYLNPASLGPYGVAGHDNSIAGGDGILILERAKQ